MELTGVELNEFLLKKAGKTWDDVVEEGATLKDIDDQSLQKFVDDSREKGRMPATKGLSVFQVLGKLQLTEGKKLKRAALLLFGKNPGKFYPNVEVRIGRFGVDATDLRFQEVVEGNIVRMLDEVQIQLNNKFLVRPVDFVGMQRIERDSYPVAALREMLLNALVHRTYMGAHVQLRVFDSRLSIWNEGALPNGLSLEDLKKEHNSRPRNPKIARACFMAGYIDAWGRGTLKIIQACKEAGLPAPEIREMNGGIEITLFQHSEAFTTEGTKKQPGMDVANRQDEVTPQVTPQVEKLLKAITGEHSRQELQEKLGLSDREYFRKTYLQPAIDAQFVAMKIPDKPNSSKQQYKLTEKGKAISRQ